MNLRSLKISLEADLAEGLRVYMAGHHFAGPTEALKAILREHLMAATPMDSAIQIAAQRAYNEVRNWIYAETRKYLEEKAAEMQAAIRPADELTAEQLLGAHARGNSL